MTDATILALATTAGTVITTLITGTVAVMVAKVSTDQKKAAVAAEEAVTVAKDTHLVIQSTHKLVNGALGAQLLANAEMAARLAMLTDTPQDREQAETSRRLYLDHVATEAADDKNRIKVAEATAAPPPMVTAPTAMIHPGEG